MYKIQVTQSKEQGNREDRRKIHATGQFFEGSGPQGHFFEKNKKKHFLDKVYGIMGKNFQVSIAFRLARRCDTNK